jgi:predicted AAA+ superfamily ATPase
MNPETINQRLSAGEVDKAGVFPHLDQLQENPFVFQIDFGLQQLPTEPGIITVRGARQYGKSTWLEQALKQSIIEFGPASAFYLNGDTLLDVNKLEQAIAELLPVFDKNAVVKRIFIDEITAIPNWEIALKRLADQGLLKEILVVTTGSSATDLRRGIERLPGRKGKLDRTNYLFTPVAYSEFHRVCHSVLKEKTLTAYLLSGGSPIACNELASKGFIPNYVLELTRDWISGEIIKSKRQLSGLNGVCQALFRFAGTNVGQAKLARETGLANNTIANGYIEVLRDLGVVTPSFPWDQHKQILLLRKPCKYHFSNLLAATVFSPQQLRRIEDFEQLDNQEQAKWLEWLVSQELLRRAAIAGKPPLEPQAFWQSKTHELDFVVSEKHYLEVKRGGVTALEFSWFAKQFPKAILDVINTNSFTTEQITGLSVENFLLGLKGA